MKRLYEVWDGLPKVGRLGLNSLRHNYRLLTAAAATILCCGSIQANALPGTILGIFSNPVKAGSVANAPVLGQSTFFDNTNSAIVGIANSTDPTLGGTPPQQSFGSVLVWGSSGSANPGFSELIFFGNPIPSSNQNQPFQLGTFTFSNGTSDLTSLIFGVTISFYDNVVSPASFLGSDRVIITTTSNIAGSPPVDDDYINICGNNSNICAKSIEAVESSEGGNGVTVNLMGTIVGDPMLQISAVTLAQGQTGIANGFIGTDPAIGAVVPEPGTWTLLGVALAMGFGVTRRLSV